MKEESLEIFLYMTAAVLRSLLLAWTRRSRKCSLAWVFLPGADQFVFIGEAVEALDHPDADSDVHEAANIELTLEQLELRKHKHVHTLTIHRVEVTVYFNGHHKRSFSPAATIATVTEWAKKTFPC
ncbi:hypothetical protein ACFS07_35655 [Undibacterium arcticum]